MQLFITIYTLVAVVQCRINNPTLDSLGDCQIVRRLDIPVHYLALVAYVHHVEVQFLTLDPLTKPGVLICF